MEESEIIFSVTESPDGGFEAKALGEPIFTQAQTMDDLGSSMRHAVRCHFRENDQPQAVRVQFSRM